MSIVIGAGTVVLILALIIFPGVRGKLKVLIGGFLNIFVEDMAKTPEGAKAVFQQAIEEVQDRYNKAGEMAYAIKRRADIMVCPGRK